MRTKVKNYAKFFTVCDMATKQKKLNLNEGKRKKVNSN